MMQGAQGEYMFRNKLFGMRLFLPCPFFFKLPQSLHSKHHFPRPAVEAMVLRLRSTGRMLWALHSTLLKGFSRDMLVVLTTTYPATLLADLRHSSTAAFADIAAAMPTSFARSASPPPNAANLAKFVARCAVPD
jgi:hypothetical protein